MPLKGLSPAQFSRISDLLDKALEIAPEDRNAWLADLERLDPDSAQVLRDLYAAERRIAAQTFMETGAILRQHLGHGVEEDLGLVGKTFGPYRVLSLIGHGGMGSVWLAERVDGLFARRVALKLINAALMGPVTKERLGREREILASLDHPNIAKLFDAGFADDGQPYLALEYVAGVPLTTYCEDRCLSIRERLELFRQVFAAVQYAHAHLVVHRDLKPANILVTADRQVRLLDFGIAKLLAAGEAKETELTQAGGRALTPAYAAPEQIAGAAITTAADVYALGVMLYEVLTGGRPYRLKRDSRGALEDAILTADPVAPSRFAVNAAIARARATTPKKLAKLLRGDLDTIVMKALKKSPGERYGTVEVFGEDVVRFLRGDIVLAQRDTFAYRAMKFARRHWAAMATAGVLVLSLAGGLAATTYEARVASAERDAGLQAQLRSLTQTAAARLRDADVSGALNIILEVLQRGGEGRLYAPQALSVFQEARAIDLQVSVITGHNDQVFSAAFSPDGQRIVTASDDKSVRIWDAATGRQVQLFAGHTERVRSAAFSPDGQRIVTASDDKSARIWDAATGRQILLLTGHGERVWSAAFSPDGRRIVTASDDHSARIWDAATGRQILLLAGHGERVRSAAFSPDGRRIVTASDDKSARIWDAATGRQALLLAGHTERIYSAAFSPDGGRVVTASLDKTARIWDAATGRQALLLAGHTDGVFSAAFSPDAQQIVTASIDKSARIWDAATGRQMLVLKGHTDQVNSAAFSPDGRYIVTASADKSERIWDAAGRQTRVLSGHTDIIYSAAFSPDGRQIVTASNDKTAQIWDAGSGRPVRLLAGHTDGVLSAAFSPDGRQVVTASYDRTARIWDAASGRQAGLLAGHTDMVGSAAFSPDGRQIVTASLDKTARIWDAATGRQLRLLAGHTDQVDSAAFSPDGRQIVTASFDRTARIWDAATGRQLRLLAGHTDWLASAAFSPDGKRIITASNDKSARIWDAATGHQVPLLSGHADGLEFAAFSPDGTHIVTASADKTARIWETATGRQVRLLAGHTDMLMSAAFSPDGRQIVTASFDKTARIWDAQVPALEAQIEWAESAQFDRLPATDRFELGLPDQGGIRRWAAGDSPCDESAAAPYDAERRAPGLLLEQIAADIAVAACSKDGRSSGNAAQTAYQEARALMASGRFSEAKRGFEAAIARGYRAARVDLAMLLAQPSAATRDLPRALALYEQAWNDGVAIAAFELGALYEHGVRVSGRDPESALAPDPDQGWRWYQKGADAGEPNALARFAARSDAGAFDEDSAAGRNRLLLEAFKYYAAAAERARREDWPEEAWRNWRYHRASLARLLAREGMMEQVAGVYVGVRNQYAPAPPTPWARLMSLAFGEAHPAPPSRRP